MQHQHHNQQSMIVRGNWRGKKGGRRQERSIFFLGDKARKEWQLIYFLLFVAKEQKKIMNPCIIKIIFYYNVSQYKFLCQKNTIIQNKTKKYVLDGSKRNVDSILCFIFHHGYTTSSIGERHSSVTKPYATPNTCI